MACQLNLVFVVLTVPLAELKGKCAQMQSLCWAVSTWKCRQSQWKRYFDFCSMYELQPLPSSVDNVCLYVTYLSSQVKYKTICNYISALWALHNWFGFPPVAKDSFLVKCTMQGAHRLLGDATLSADPLLPEDLVRVYRTLNYKDLHDLVFWAALCLGYRCLLRKGHFTSSPHTILRKHVEFTDYGLCLRLESSKTVQYHERDVVIPVVESPGSILCPVRWLRVYLKRFNVSNSAPLFIVPGKKSNAISYKFFAKRLSSSLKSAGLNGNYTSHSLRRGCATFLSRLGMPLHDIKTYGDWRSLSVLLYLSNDITTRLGKDFSVAKSFKQFV